MGRVPSQCWPVEKYRLLFDELHKTHPQIGFALIGGADAKEAAKSIVEGICLGKHVIDFTGRTTLEQAASLMQKCVLYIGSNTGLMHMAVALSKPVVEIDFYLRDMDGRLNSPMGVWKSPAVILQKQGCDDCFEICSKPYPHCIKQISVEEVLNAIIDMMRFDV